MIKLLNARLGFATNSSSSHSMIFVKDEKTRKSISDRSPENGEDHFGWDNFVLKTKEDKLRYLAVTLRSNLKEELPDNIVDLICKDWVGVAPSKDGYVDHQSVLAFPKAFGKEFVDEDFLREFVKACLRPEVIILGGNDNDEDGHPERSFPEFKHGLMREGSQSIHCRREEDYWIVFNKENGSKVRLSLNGDKDLKKLKPKTPELVDVKITDFCPFDCSFCYQGSTTKGMHGDDLYRFARAMAEMQVFEVAIGGGEPTLHPQFLNFLKDLKIAGVTPNFTTRNKAIFQDPIKIREIFDLVGGIAFSTSDTKEVEELQKFLIKADLEDKANKIVIQSIIGPALIDDDYDLRKMMKACSDAGFSLTLLGFKDTGRGDDYKKAYFNKNWDTKWWIDTAISARDKDRIYVNLSIDTKLAEKFEEDLKKVVSQRLFTTKEGQYSCYIDLVKNKIGPSSYCDEKEMIPFKNDYEMASELTKIFGRF